jgi:hypothetical protein
MASQTPVEIWHKILKYAISVPLFLDTNPAETLGIDSIANYYFELEYWESEHTRYSLRAVCRGWNDFLRRYDHRYVRLEDVFHERIPLSAIPLAIRLNVEPDSMCECKQYCNIDTRQSLLKRLLGKTSKLTNRMKVLERAMALVDASQGPLTWNLEILDGQVTNDGKGFDLLKQRAPRLASVIGNAGHHLSTVSSLSDALLTFTLSDHCGLEDPNFSDILNFSNLTTLRLSLISVDLLIEKWSLPSLRHLGVHYYGAYRNRDSQRSLIDILQVLGGNLETMYFHNNIEENLAPQELWTVCPKLLRVQMPYKWVSRPPNEHPIRCFRISVKDLVDYVDDRLDFVDYVNDGFIRALIHALEFLPIPPVISNIRQNRSDFEVRLDETWSRVLLRSNSYITGLALFICDHYHNYNVQLRDAEGVTFRNFILYMLLHHWKRSSYRSRRKFPTRNPLFF